ncbi:unnamed protein product, partial [Medioppia subpectinata]
MFSILYYFNKQANNSIYTYWTPLGFVLTVTLIQEAVDDILRFKRDKQINRQNYKKLTPSGAQVACHSSDMRVGDLIVVSKDQRVPADMVFLRTSVKTGACFVRTDQLDGETDWKLRLAVADTQCLDSDDQLFGWEACVHAEEPRRDIHSFTGKVTVGSVGRTSISKEISLNIENTLWANTVVASGTAIGLVIYTGPDTRSMMNNNEPRSKVGLLDFEINTLTKILCIALCVMSLAMIVLRGYWGSYYVIVYWVRFVMAFSYMIPISLRVNLEIGRVVYSYMIGRDVEIPGTVVRTTTIPEDLGRIAYLLTDKTGTLTRNEMVFKKIHLGKIAYTTEYFDELVALLQAYYVPQPEPSPKTYHSGGSGGHSGGHRRNLSNISTASFTVERRRYMPQHMRVDSYEVDRDSVQRVQQAVLACALCHNVTPSYESYDPVPDSPVVNELSKMPPMPDPGIITYQASSPDEVALVQWTERLGVALVYRDPTSMKLRDPNGNTLAYDILHIFPFSSETKRMGIIVREVKTGEITFLLKGADTVMATIVTASDWLQEQSDNMARSGLRTLVVAKKQLTADQYR